MDESNLSVSELSGSWFDVSQDSASYPFSDGVSVAAFIKRRDELGGSLFFDDLLSLAGIETQLFPPRTPEELLALLEEVANSYWEEIRRQCLHYYLLKCWKDGREQKYAIANLITPSFTILLDAYFYLDDNAMREAVQCLCDPRVLPDFIPKIMRALSLASSELVVKFVRFAKPTLQEESLDIYLRALCSQSIAAAWSYARLFPEIPSEDAQRCRLVWTVLEYCLIPKPRPSELMILLTLPLTPFEQTVINTYALRPPRALSEQSLAILQDLITVRLIHQGKYSDAITLDRLFLSEAAAASRMGGAVTKAAETRRETFKEIISVLPDIQQRLLELKLDDYQNGGPGTQNQPADLSASWEEVGPVGETTPHRNAPPATPMSASAAFRKANPKIAVLRAFTQTNGTSPKLEGTPVTSTPGPSRGRVPGSLHPSIAPSQFGQAPGTPIDPFLSRPKLASTPFNTLIRPFVSGSISVSPFSTPARDLRGSTSSARQLPFRASTSNQPATSPFHRPIPTVGRPVATAPAQPFDPFKPTTTLSHTPWMARPANGVANPTLNQSKVTPTKRSRGNVESLWSEADGLDERTPVLFDHLEEDPEVARLSRLAAPFPNPPPHLSPSAMHEDIVDAEEAEEVLVKDEGTDNEFPGAFPHTEEQTIQEQSNIRSSDNHDRLALPTFLSSAPTPKPKATRSKATHKNIPSHPEMPALPTRTASRGSRRSPSVTSDIGEVSSRTLRRSSRLSAVPSSPEPKTKRSRSSSSPPPTIAKSKRKPTMLSAPPFSKRSTRRTASALGNVEE